MISFWRGGSFETQDKKCRWSRSIFHGEARYSTRSRWYTLASRIRSLPALSDTYWSTRAGTPNGWEEAWWSRHDLLWIESTDSSIQFKIRTRNLDQAPADYRLSRTKYRLSACYQHLLWRRFSVDCSPQDLPSRRDRLSRLSHSDQGSCRQRVL